MAAKVKLAAPTARGLHQLCDITQTLIIKMSEYDVCACERDREREERESVRERQRETDRQTDR